MSQSTLPQYDLEELARPLIALLDEYRDQFIGWVKIHQLLLAGNPVTPDPIAAPLGLSEEEVADLLKGAELDQEGNLVGLGLSVVPTPHAYRIQSRQLYVWCAFDAILPWFMRRREDCPHVAMINDVTPSAPGCEECLRMGMEKPLILLADNWQMSVQPQSAPGRHGSNLLKQ